MSALLYVHNDAITVHSSITGKRILINPSDKYAALPNITEDGLATAVDEWWGRCMAMLERIRACRGGKSPIAETGLHEESVELSDNLRNAKSLLCFNAALNETIARVVYIEHVAKNSESRGTKKIGRRCGEARRLYELLATLRKHGLILFPAAEMWNASIIEANALPPIDDVYFPGLNWINDYKHEIRHPLQRRPVKLLCLATFGADHPGDFDYKIMELVREFAPCPASNSVYGMCDLLISAQRKAYLDQEDMYARLPQSYREVFRKKLAPRSDTEFKWAIHSGGDRLNQWADSSSAYLGSLSNRVSMAVTIGHLNSLLDYIIWDNSIPPSPLEYCHRAFEPNFSFNEFLEETTSRSATGRSSATRLVSRFFDWALLTYGRDDAGDLLPGLRNPIDDSEIPTQEGPKGQTHRLAIPIRFLRMMREILESPDSDGVPTFAWAKTLQSDYFEWLNPDTKIKERIWSPARTNLLLLRLMLPIRGFQARHLDSGEADSMIYRPEQGGWVENGGRLALNASSDRSPTGLLRQIWDTDAGRWFTGIYISTNKTQDRTSGFIEPGYEIPWENPDVIELFCRLRDWQERHNPCLRPLSRSELKSDPRLAVSADVAERIDKLCFLFRDAAAPAHPQEPPTDGRMATIWRFLVKELEDRLAAANATNHDGSPIKLVTGVRKDGSPAAPIFDLHSLRVAGLTALAAAGVDIHILSRFVAGHVALVMTFYYLKPSPWDISVALDEAVLKISELEIKNWDAYLKGAPFELIHEIAVYNSDDAAKAAAATQSSLWSTLDDGICPNGGTKCASGGERLINGKNAYAPVPGGPRNCAMCRFFVTGPPFLGGLVAKFNATGGRLREKLNRLLDAEAQRRSLAARALEAERAGHAFEENDLLLKCDEIAQGIQDEFKPLADSWVAQLRLIKRVEAVLENTQSRSTDTNDLVLNGGLADLRVSLEECSEFDLWDRICQSSAFYPSVDARLPAIRRARVFDAMFAREGKPSAFATLTDKQLVQVGNAFATFLRTRLGDQVANDLVAGTETIRALGIEDELHAIIADSINPVRECDRQAAALPPVPLRLNYDRSDSSVRPHAADEQRD